MFIEHVIVEAQNYEGMFADILKTSPNPQLRRQIVDNIDWARRTLRKNDRIVWFLRWVKLWLSSAGAASGTNTSPPGTLQVGAPGSRSAVTPSGGPIPIQQYNRRFATAHGAGDVMPSPALKQRLEHFLSLPVPEIQNQVFKTESPRQLFDTFTKYEATWRQQMEEEQSLITPEDEDEILIEFPDGYAWWLLPRGGCPVEAEAMGHCGNVPSERPGDRILSLRRKVNRGDIVRWYPVATFILDADGQLGEMKGRGNDKPQPKYHPYVVALLRHHVIRGIKGGGYMPENNFSMSDLEPETREELIAQKPDLKGLLGYYEEEGMTERVLDMLGDQLAARDLPEYDTYDPVKREFVLSTYRDLEQFVSANNDEVLAQLLELHERALDSHSDMLSAKADLNDEILRRYLETLPAGAFADIGKSVGIDPTISNAKQLVARHLEFYGGPMFDRIEHAFATASGHEAIVRALDERIAQYVNEGWSFECSFVRAAFVNPTNPVGLAIEIRISEWDLVYIVAAEDDGDDEHAYDAQTVSHNRSWDDVGWDNTFEHRRENGLIRRKSGGGSWDYIDAEFADPEHLKFDTDDLIDAAVEVYLNPRKSSPTIRDFRQFELTLEALRRRAGIGAALRRVPAIALRRTDGCSGAQPCTGP